MNPKISNLANQIKASKKSGDKFVLMLGAGASLASGIKRTDQIMTELLAEYGAGIPGADIGEKFSVLWQGFTKQNKNDYLEPYLSKPPSPGYGHLATLAREGYIDAILTFNFDRVLETALRDAGLREGDDFKVIVIGDNSESAVVELMNMPKPRIKVLKLHGSLTGTTFLWTDREMATYPAAIEKLVNEMTSRPLVICGYGFQDTCMVRAFSSKGGQIYYVNPAEPPGSMKGLMRVRESGPLTTIGGSDGYFDGFFEQVSAALAPAPKTGPLKPAVNPFKYLESYEIADRDTFFGRDEKVNELISTIEQRKSPLIFVMGPPKVGKTALLRAGVLAGLDVERFEIIYVRCRGNLKQTLVPLIKWLPQGTQPESGVDLLNQVADVTTKHVVVVLDQFERILSQETERAEVLRKLAEKTRKNLTVVCVSVDDEVTKDALLDFMMQTGVKLEVKPEYIKLNEIPAKGVSEIVQRLANGAGVPFAPEVIQELETEYERKGQPQRFTLAHVQAICHVLCAQDATDIDLCRRLMQEDQRATLDLAINRYDTINFMEDFSELEERSLLRDLIRLVPHARCNETIVNYVQKHVNDRWAAAAEKVAATAARAATASGCPGGISSPGAGSPEAGK